MGELYSVWLKKRQTNKPYTWGKKAIDSENEKFY